MTEKVRKNENSQYFFENEITLYYGQFDVFVIDTRKIGLYYGQNLSSRFENRL